MAAKKTENKDKENKKTELSKTKVSQTQQVSDTKESSEKTPTKVSKKQKKVKLVSAKKLPPLFKKSYTTEKYEKKIGKHIYIKTDREFIDKIFVPAKDKKSRDIVKVDLTKNLPKNDVKRYKVLAKQIKSQKGGIKIVPLLAVVILVAAIGICFTLFKNVIIKKGIVSAMQGIFQAKTDIEKVDFQFFGSSLDIRGLQQANKDEPMKNLFQMDDIMIDFNLTDLCREKFHAENLIVAGVALGTDRKTSGELPAKVKKEKKTSEESEISKKAEELKNAAMNSLLAMFADYNPEKMLSDLQDELKSPTLAAEISTNVQEKVAKWQEIPSQIQTQVTEFSTSVNDVIKTDWSKVSDPTRLKNALESLNSAYTKGTSLKTSIEKTTKEIESDSKEVAGYANQVESAVKSDLNLVETKIADVKNLFSPEGLKEIMNEAVQSMLYSVLGKYYPYVNTAMDKVTEIKASTAAKSEKSEKTEKSEKKAKKNKTETKRERLSGRDIYFKKDTVPKLLINNVVASGYEYGKETVEENLLFKGVATDISSNPDMYGKPAKAEADFKIGANKNNAKIVVDARTNTTAPLVYADYTGNGYSINADAQVFSFESSSNIKANMSADSDGSFKIGGNVDLSMNGIKGFEFEPVRLSNLYNNALGGIKNLTLGFTIDCDKSNGVAVSIDNLDRLASQLVNPITKAVSGELNSIASEAQTKVTAMLSEKTGVATDKIAQFTNIEGLIGNQKNSLDSLQNQLDSKKKELENQIKNAAKGAATDALKNIIPGSDSSFGSGDTKNDAASALKNAASGLFKK